MKLCLVTHRVIPGDGQGRVNYEIVGEAIRRGHEVTLLASAIAPDLVQHNQINWIPIFVQGWPTELLRNLIFSWKSTLWLRQHHAEFDVIKVNGAITHFPGDVNAVHFIHSAWARSRVHTIRVHRNLYSLYQWIYTALNAAWEKHAFRRAKVIVAVSKKIKEELVAIGVPPQKIKVIFNGVDIEEFHPKKVERINFGLPEKVPLAFFAGDIRTPRKNLDTVLHALVQVQELHLAVAGSTKDSPYPQLAGELDIDERVHFLGYRQDIPQLMQAVDFFVFPSRYEAFTLVLLEAMASELPVITAMTSGGAEVVTPDSGIILSNPDDVKALVEALQTLTNNAPLRNQMGQAARKVAQKHTWAVMARSYLNLFEQLNY
ncbi:MAG: glycosyltransferase [Cyanobacteria bacterium]|jgi:glycosyltransferase involved in cell wall biosynthesis|nr:glycosyltransferase [Cyanobacteria bacterium GSL.Bin1]